ncbi:FAD-dependent oxidoreductase [Pseudonocardia sp. D17]|uniref:FAD-dependent oxidoreductase n=1 Tax=Pseudonocardia sp. D17 TaxID=882661 RepID=UPI002B3C9DFC|nr:FAD-dependent oxidoreductase [Pseudonocardia sp. D17]
MNDTRTALVVGGGIAGPVAAMALAKAGIEATIVEAYPGGADGVGGALGLAPNGINALAVVGVDEAVRAAGQPMVAMVLQSGTGKRLAELRTAPDLPTPQFVNRHDLYRALHDEAERRGVRVSFGKRLTGLHDDGAAVTARFADGTTATADVLVGADGLRSAVRPLIDPAAPGPRNCGLLNVGAAVPDTGLTPTAGAMHMIFGRRAFFGYQVFDDGSGGWFANLPDQRRMTAAQARELGVPHWRNVLHTAFADDRGPALDLVDRTADDDLLLLGATEDLPSVPTWSHGRVVLVGDAAHATSPSSGQGASLAAESAVELARCLRDLPHTEAFAAYETIRRPRVEKIIAMAARTNSAKAAGPVGRVLRDALLPTVMRRFVTPEKTAWRDAYRIDWDTPVSTVAVAA